MKKNLVQKSIGFYEEDWYKGLPLLVYMGGYKNKSEAVRELVRKEAEKLREENGISEVKI